MPARSAAPKDRREYVRISVDMPMNPKLASLDNPAAGWLAVCAIAYCGQNLTDGEFVPGVVYRLAGVDPAVGKDLIDVGLWHEPGHECPTCEQPGERKLIVHDYLEHQRSKEEAQTLRSARSEAGSKGAEKRWAAKRAVAEQEAIDKAEGIANAIASAMANGWQDDGKAMAEVEVEEEKEQTLFVPPDGETVSKRKTLDDHFAEVYSAYPRKVGRQDARTAWDKARKRSDIAVILAGAIRYRDDPNLPTDKNYIPHPATWFTRGGWDDEPCPARAPEPEKRPTRSTGRPSAPEGW